MTNSTECAIIKVPKGKEMIQCLVERLKGLLSLTFTISGENGTQTTPTSTITTVQDLHLALSLGTAPLTMKMRGDSLRIGLGDL